MPDRAAGGRRPLRIRAGREADAAELQRLVADAFAPFEARTGVRPEPVGTDWPTVVSAHGVRVATLDDAVVGVLVLWPHPDHVLVETLAVDPAAQGAGVGTALLDVAERLALETGTNAVRLSTNAAMDEALAWYPRRGYREVGRGAERGWDRVRFEKRLTP